MNALPTIQIQFYLEGIPEVLAVRHWTGVPRVGESVQLTLPDSISVRKLFTVVSVIWGSAIVDDKPANASVAITVQLPTEKTT